MDKAESDFVSDKADIWPPNHKPAHWNPPLLLFFALAPIPETRKVQSHPDCLKTTHKEKMETRAQMSLTKLTPQTKLLDTLRQQYIKKSLSPLPFPEMWVFLKKKPNKQHFLLY